MKRIKTRLIALYRILTLNNFILIEAKKKDGVLHSRISCRTDFDDEEDARVLKFQYEKLTTKKS